MSDPLRAQIAERGGLCTVSDLADRWGLTRQRVEQLARSADFPTAVYEGGSGRRLWFGDEADAWRAKQSKSSR